MRGVRRSPQQVEELRARVAALHGWYHAIDLGDGVITPGPFAIAEHLAHYRLPEDMSGLSVLDVGCANGFFSVECVARGAAQVVAVDVPGWLDRDWSPRYRREFIARTHPAERRDIDEVSIRGTFRLVVDELGRGRVHRVEASIYDLAPLHHGRFDLVLCASVLMHLRDPLLALQRLREVCRDDGLLVVSTSIAPELGDTAAARFVGDPRSGNFWQMTPACLGRMLAWAAFAPVDGGHHFVLRDRATGRLPDCDAQGRRIDPRATPGSGAFEDPHFVQHARPVPDGEEPGP
jgi:tRNA (mo5U34)-methyltransferase